MLNKNGERELAYVVLVDGIEPIPGYDRVEHAIVGGWRCIVPKGQFKVGDPAIYFEIDSRVPKDRECFAFLEKRNYKIKTLKMCKTISQGLLMHAEDFGWNIIFDGTETPYIYDGEKVHYADDETRFVTKILNVTYADEEDNQRKAPSVDKYKKMAQRNPALFKKPYIRWLMRRDWGKKLLFFFFGKKKDKKNGWPSWVAKTDEERIENMPWILADKDKKWIATEKIDGTSTTFTMKREAPWGKKTMYVCSRNVCFDSVDKPCYYETNVYWGMAECYNIYKVLEYILEKYSLDWVTIQGETYGEGIQKNNYGMDYHDFYAFNLITSDRGRWNSVDMSKELNGLGIPCVPIFETEMTLPDTVEELRDYIRGYSSDVYPGMMEGMVFRTQDGVQSFKCVLPEYLLKYHS